jgi:exopolyphosphatase/guanosine-5'-triphosphate,3'-diphosphate pyrophosphatase
MNDLLKSARREGVERAIGTSGTVNTLVAMARAARGEELGRLGGATATAEEISQVRRSILGCDLSDRMELPGIDAKRADLMPAAALLTDYILRHSGAPQLVACTWALREGLLLELAGIASRREAIDARKHSVAALAQKFEGSNAHGQTVAKLAGQLFDATAEALELPANSREVLEYAALLHDIGHSIDHDRHNRHSYYLIKNADLFGFTPDEIESIAQVARGHRKQGAKVDSPELYALPEEKRRWVRALAAILRVADGLDRTHFGVVKNVHVSYGPGKLFIDVDAGSERSDLELWTCEKRVDLLAKLLGRRVVLRPRIHGRKKSHLLDASAAIVGRQKAV